MTSVGRSNIPSSPPFLCVTIHSCRSMQEMVQRHLLHEFQIPYPNAHFGEFCPQIELKWVGPFFEFHYLRIGAKASHI